MRGARRLRWLWSADQSRTKRGRELRCGARPGRPGAGILGHGEGRGAAAEAHLCPAALRLLFAQPLASEREEEGKGEKGLNPARGDQKSAGTTAGGGVGS